jgi:uncharacterized transporter YbjL
MIFTMYALLARRRNVESKVNLIAVAVASIMVSKFVVSSTLPSSAGFSLYGNIENMTLLLLVLTTGFVIAPDFFKKLEFMATRKVRGAFAIFAIAFYGITNIYFIASSYYDYQNAFNHLKTSCGKSTLGGINGEVQKIIKSKETEKLK